MTSPYKISTRKTKQTPQTEAIPGREAEMKTNDAGGVTFVLDPWKALDRFLILGSEGGTYYVSEQKHTNRNADNVRRLIQQDGVRFVKQVVDVSTSGRAHKNEPALFCLSLALQLGDLKTRLLAADRLPSVARTGTHLFHMAEFINNLCGWGRLKRRAFASWYRGWSPMQLVNQLIKYRQRDGWTHKDVLALSHPWAAYHGTKPSDEVITIFKSVRDGISAHEEALMRSEAGKVLVAFRDLQSSASSEGASTRPTPQALEAIRQHKFPREALPTEWLNYPESWQAILPHMGMTALIRTLGLMTEKGVLADVRKANEVAERIKSKEELSRARIHPFGILLAHKTYGQGRGFKGDGSWTPIPQVMDALDSAFYIAFESIEPTGKVFYLGVDVSGSMSTSVISNSNVSCCEAAACMALAVAKVEKNYYIKGFCGNMVDLGITARDTLSSAASKAQKNNFGTTDCGLPIFDAIKSKTFVDCFVIITDNETYAGQHGHPSQLLKRYRREVNPNARMAVIGMTGTIQSIADPKDSGMLDVVGFDANAPALIQQFASGNI